METTTPISPHQELENHNHPPETTPVPPISPPQAAVPSPPLPIEYGDHQQQFTNSVSPPSPPQQPENSLDRQQYSPPEDVERLQQQFTNSVSPPSPPQQPENSLDRQQYSPPEDVEGLHEPPSPPPEEKFDSQEPLEPPSPPPVEKTDNQQVLEPPSPSSHLSPSPPPTGTELPPENFSSNHESPISKRSPSPSPPPTGAEDPVESPNSRINPNPTSDHESPISIQPPPSGPDDPVTSPNYRQTPSPNPNLDHESPSPSSPAKFQGSPSPNPNLDHDSPSPSSPANFQGNPSPKPNQSSKDPSPSPPLTAGSPSSPQDTLEPNTTLTPPLGVPLLLHVAAGSPPSNKPQISPWTPQETANLIQAYQEKWYSLKKGPLKAGQWEEVAITVAARCGYDEPTKTSKQCRHKLEKLRKRYRAERAKPRSKAAAWNFFKLMDNLEKGPLPISSSPPTALTTYQKPSNSNGKKRKNVDDEVDEDDDGDHEFLINKRRSRSKNYNHHVPNGYLTRNLRFPDGGSRVVRGLRTPVVHKQKGFYQEDDAEDEEEEEEEEHDEGGANGGEGGGGVAAQLAVEIKGFAEKFVKMENKKIEMMRDVERYRLEMENKRMQMIVESQQMLVETVNKAFHKAHKLSAS